VSFSKCFADFLVESLGEHIKREKLSIAENMLAFEIPKEDIVKITGLKKEEIENFCSSK
jgi:hypothetical protein